MEVRLFVKSHPDFTWAGSDDAMDVRSHPIPLLKTANRQKTFSATSYATFRPSYPQKLYTTVLSYHRGPRNTLLDLGCGHGLISRALAPHFTHVFGTDPSHNMIAQAEASSENRLRSPNIEWKVASAENLQFVEDGSLDMVVAGQAAHWFDFGRVWREVHRKLRRGGTVAFWGYKDNLLVDFPGATGVLDRFCYGVGSGFLGAFWEQPGRERLRGLYADEVMFPPADMFEAVQRITYEPGLHGKGSGRGEVLMGMRMTLGELEGYWRTFSAYHEWMRAHPERRRLEVGGVGGLEPAGDVDGKGDVLDDMFIEMLKVEPELRGKDGKDWRDVEVETEWGSVILLARKL
ncbi:trans-aconitate methyltransferase 1 [Ciborinia camelliae]|nr:trans-aconitate methyltransferase 1 [Ciborinia camelliae]